MQDEWSVYASVRNLSRNRLLLARHSELLDDFLRVFGQVSQEKKVLDIGPGNGLFMVLLRELGFDHVDGLEISPVFLKLLHSKNLAAHPGDIAKGSGLDQLSPPYDAVLMMEVLEHLDEPERALKNVRELLSEDSFVYITVPICDCIFDRVRRVKHGILRQDQVRNIDDTHIHVFSPQGLAELLDRTGFKVRDLRRVSFRPTTLIRYYPGRKLFLLLRALLPNRFRGFCLSVIARLANARRE